MRARYAVCAALLAAFAGAAARYAWPHVRAMVEEVRVPGPAVEYRKIADALGRVCGWDDEHGLATGETNFELLRDIEANWDAETRMFAGRTDLVRAGPRLTIGSGEKSMHFIDYGYFCHNSDILIFTYRQKLAKTDLHVLSARFYETSSAVLVSVEARQEAYTFAQILESPSGKRVVASKPEDLDGHSGGYEILRVDGGRIVSELQQVNYAPLSDANRDPFPRNRFRDVLGWIDDETLLLLLSDGQQIALALRDGKWRLKEPLP